MEAWLIKCLNRPRQAEGLVTPDDNKSNKDATNYSLWGVHGPTLIGVSV